MKIIFIILLFPLAVIAQTNTNKAITKGESDLKALKGLFVKHKKDSAAAQNKNNNTVTAKSDDPTASYNNIAVTGSSKNIIYAGKVTSETKTIDCDEAAPVRPRDFNYGLCIIQKGNSYALIDSGAKFIVPYGKFSSITFHGGLAYLQSNKEIFICTSQKKLIADTYFEHLNLSASNLSSNFVLYGNSFAIDNKGNKYNLTPGKLDDGSTSESFLDIKGNVILFTTFGKNAKEEFGIKNIISDKVILYYDDGYVTFSEFSQLFVDGFVDDGYGLYILKDEYGKYTYGIISETGEKTTPAKFSSISNLGGGYFHVNGAPESEISNAIINYKGDIIYKELKVAKDHYNFDRYEEGYFFGEGVRGANGRTTYMMDTAGNIWNQSDFLVKVGFSISKNIYFDGPYIFQPPASYISSVIRLGNKDGFLIFRYVNNHISAAINLQGLYNIKTGKIIMGNFTALSSFDPVSGLAYAEQDTDTKNPGGQEVYNKGYINREGNFVILLKKQMSEF